MKGKIDLCYFRLESYKYLEDEEVKKNLIKVDFNFNPEYKIRYANKNLKIEKNDDYIPNFYNMNGSNISNITAIIGKNGSGKTTLLEILTKILHTRTFYQYDFILVFKEDDRFHVFSKKGLINENVEHEFELTTYTNEVIAYNICKPVLDKISTIYFSNVFNLRNKQIESTNVKENFFNISLEEDMYKNNNNRNIELNRSYLNEKFIDERFINNRNIQEARNNITIRNFKFLSQDNSLLEVENMNFIPKCYQLLGIFGSSLDNLRYFRKLSPEKESNKYLEKLDISMKSKERKIYEQIEFDIAHAKSNDRKIVLYILYFILIDKFFEELYNKINNNYLIDLIKNEIEKNIKTDRAINMFHQVLEVIKNIKIEKMEERYRKSIEKKEQAKDYAYDLQNFLQKFCKKYEQTLRNFNSIIRDEQIIVQATKLYENENLEPNKCLYQIIPIISIPKEKLNKIAGIISEDSNFLELFNFEFKGLSSGQQALLNIYSNFYDVLNKIKKIENTLIIMDEPELYFHPEWQRNFIYFIIEFFNLYYKDKNVQIIFTSNSPYVLSDLNKSSVITLGKEKENKTFAGNIMYLLLDNYFMEDTIGKFSEEKIKEIIKRIKNNSVFEEDLKVIEQIGEDIIRKNIKEMIKKYDKN